MKHQSFTLHPGITGWNHSARRHPLGYSTSLRVSACMDSSVRTLEQGLQFDDYILGRDQFAKIL